MPALHCNLTPPPRRRTGLWAALLVLATGIGVEIQWRSELLDQISDQQHRLNQLERRSRLQAQLTQAAATPADPVAAAQINRIARELTQPWEPMLDSVQALSGNSITLSKIQPEMPAGLMRLQGRATNVNAFLDFVQRLKQQPHWQQVEPVSEDTDTQPSDKPLHFELTARWSPS